MHFLKMDQRTVGAVILTLGILSLISLLRGLYDMKHGHVFYKRLFRFSVVALSVIILNILNYQVRKILNDSALSGPMIEFMKNLSFLGGVSCLSSSFVALGIYPILLDSDQL